MVKPGDEATCVHACYAVARLADTCKLLLAHLDRKSLKPCTKCCTQLEEWGAWVKHKGATRVDSQGQHTIIMCFSVSPCLFACLCLY